MLDGYDWAGRTGRRHRQLILDFLAVTPFDRAVETAFRAWLAEEALPREPNSAALEEQVCTWFARRRITQPGPYRLDRLVASTRAAHDERAFRTVAERLDAETRHRLDALLADDGTGSGFSSLQADPGRVGLESLFAEIGKLEIVRALKLPPGILKQHHPELIKRFRRRVATEAVWELRRHPEHIRLPLLVFYCVPREGEIIDGLIELLLEITHRITVRAERRVVEELLDEYRQVRGKTGILFRVAEAAVSNPEGIVREVIFPVAGEQTFEDLVKEYRTSGTQQNRRIHTVIRASYGSYYRRMLPKLLSALEFRSNNATHRPLLQGLQHADFVIDAVDAFAPVQGDFALSEIAVEDVIRAKWRDIVGAGWFRRGPMWPGCSTRPAPRGPCPGLSQPPIGCRSASCCRAALLFIILVTSRRIT